MKINKDWFIITLAFILSTLALYFYFFAPGRFGIVYKNWDGPGYVLAAISLYDPEVAADNNFIQSVDINSHWTWLPAHFPLYPLMIRGAYEIFGGRVGYFPIALVISLAFSLGALIAFYELAKRVKFVKNPLLLTLPMIVMTPRWFLVSHIAGSEPVFLFFITLGLLFLQDKRAWYAALSFALAQISRPQGALIALAIALYALYELIKSRDIKKVFLAYYPYLLITSALLLVFSFYYFRTGDFWAFFSAISIFHHFNPTPFSTFSYRAINIETFWQEVNAMDYLLYFAAVLFMFKKKLPLYGLIGLTIFIPLLFLQHSDISRYALPLLPIMFLAYSEIFETKTFNLASLLMLPAVVAYAINFMIYNHAP